MIAALCAFLTCGTTPELDRSGVMLEAIIAARPKPTCASSLVQLTTLPPCVPAAASWWVAERGRR
jgi:hypothetical protein